MAAVGEGVVVEVEAVLAWAAAPQQPEPALAAAEGRSRRVPWAARPSPRSLVQTAQGPELPAGVRRAAVAPQSAALSGPVARFSSVVAEAVVAEVE